MLLNREKTLSVEEIEQHFSAAMDSVNLINELNKKDTLTDEEQEIIHRNKEHLRLVIEKKWFTEEQNSILRSVL